jgi:hypothetical protein
MNIHILRDAMVMQRQNDQKVVNHACAIAQCEWDDLIIAQRCPPLLKLILVKLISQQLLKVFGLNA